MIPPPDPAGLRGLCDGFRGRFFYDAERGDIGYIAKACDDKQCDCEVKVNADGDQDCSHSLSDWEGEDHLCEPIAQMLNAIPGLLDEVGRLRSLLVEACDIGLPHAERNGDDKDVARLSAIRAASEVES
jgi:hypothetical protein